jgi:hypothetical protein
MSLLTAQAQIRPSRAITAEPLQSAALVLVFGVLLSFMGLSWDVQWHVDVGPDTFFTMPHLVLYSGIALAGLASLFAVLWWAWQQRNQPSLVGLLSDAWRAPIGFIIGGFGAAIFLAYGLYDLWWHEVYGFDVTFESPPHIGLLFGMQISMVGALTVYAQQAHRAAQRSALSLPALGLAMAVVIALGGTVPFLTIVPVSIGPFAAYKLAPAALYVVALLAISAVVRRPGTATLLGVLFVLLREVTAIFVQWATPSYASSIGLFMRENLQPYAEMAEMMSPSLLFAALLVDLVLLFGRRVVGLRLAVIGAGALAGLLVTWFYQPLSYGSALVELTTGGEGGMLPTLLLAPLIGAASGWLGWMVGVLVRGNAEEGAN